jgi:hypothetical protein
MAALSLMGFLHQIWGASTALTALVPVASVFTGRVPPLGQTTTPYVRIERTSGAAGIRTNRSLQPIIEIVFHAWTDTHDQGETIANAIIQAYAQAEFDYSDGSVADMRLENCIPRQVEFAELTMWEWLVTFNLRTYRTRRA